MSSIRGTISRLSRSLERLGSCSTLMTCRRGLRSPDPIPSCWCTCCACSRPRCWSRPSSAASSFHRSLPILTRMTAGVKARSRRPAHRGAASHWPMPSLHGYDSATTADLCTAVAAASDGGCRSPTPPRYGRRDRREPPPGIGVPPDHSAEQHRGDLVPSESVRRAIAVCGNVVIARATGAVVTSARELVPAGVAIGEGSANAAELRTHSGEQEVRDHGHVKTSLPSRPGHQTHRHRGWLCSRASWRSLAHPSNTVAAVAESKPCGCGFQ